METLPNLPTVRSCANLLLKRPEYSELAALARERSRTAIVCICQIEADTNDRGSKLWQQALETCAYFTAPAKRGGPVPPLFDESNPLGLTADLQRLGWCAAQARSRLSAENWRAVSVLQREFHDAAQVKRDPRETLDTLFQQGGQSG